MAMGVGGPVGAMLLSAGIDTLIQKATTGTVNYGEVALVGVTAGIGDFGIAAKAGLTGLKAVATSGAISGTVAGAGLGGYNYATSAGPHTALGAVAHVGTGALVGGTIGAGSASLGRVFTNRVDSAVTTKLHPNGVPTPKHIATPKHVAPPTHPTSTAGRIAGAAASHGQNGLLAALNDYANGERDAGPLTRSGLVGAVMGGPKGMYHPQHAAR